MSKLIPLQFVWETLQVNTVENTEISLFIFYKEFCAKLNWQFSFDTCKDSTQFNIVNPAICVVPVIHTNISDCCF